jgi:hypothetical protein
MVVASRAALGDGANIQLLCAITSGCFATAAAATSQSGGRGSCKQGGGGNGGVGRWSDRSDSGAAATVYLAVLVGPDAQGLERTSAAWLQRSLGQRLFADASHVEAHLATLAVRVLGRDEPSGVAGQLFLAILP